VEIQKFFVLLHQVSAYRREATHGVGYSACLILHHEGNLLVKFSSLSGGAGMSFEGITLALAIIQNVQKLAGGKNIL
jgi:hypothetical protein